MLVVVAILLALILFALAPKLVGSLVAGGLAFVGAVALVVLCTFLILNVAWSGLLITLAGMGIIWAATSLRAERPEVWSAIERAMFRGLSSAGWVLTTGAVLGCCVLAHRADYDNASTLLGAAAVLGVIAAGLMRGARDTGVAGPDDATLRQLSLLVETPPSELALSAGLQRSRPSSLDHTSDQNPMHTP